jgi:signal transduction histidine kinase
MKLHAAILDSEDGCCHVRLSPNLQIGALMPRVLHVRVLLVDDSPAEIFRLSSLLAECGQGIVATCACGYDAGMAAILSKPDGFDALLVDLHLDRSDGLGFISDARDCGCIAPAVILTWDDNLAHDARAMRSGADDYLPKAMLSPALLSRTLRHASERHRSDAQLRIREARWRGLARSFPNGGVLVVDRRECIASAEGSALDRLGLAACQGKPLDDVLDPGITALLRSASGAIDVRIADRHCLLTFAPVIEDGSRLLVIQDRTEEVRSTEAAAVNERMASIGALAAGVSHEFNNLLTIISGFTEAAMRESARPQRVLQRMSVVREATQRARSVSDHLLGFARPSQMDVASCDVSQAVRSTVTLLRGDLSARGMFVDISTLTSSRAAISHPALCQILLNLLLNARQALSSRRSGLIRIEAQDADDRVRIRISDDGPGIPDALLTQLFRPFIGAHAAGTGLGLSICRTLVEHAAGTISASNHAAGGALFQIDLPIAIDRDAEIRSAPTERTALLPPPGTILVVEDESNLRELLVEDFADSGWDVRSAGDGQTALTIMAAETIDLLLLDMQMPCMDGAGVLAGLEQIPTGHRPAVVVMSGTLIAPEIDQAVDGVLHKPFDLADAHRLVAKAWTNATGRSVRNR